jgi:lipopolysaccharide/colanic/teichoic acid biosynthesis glycosyltransferase
VAISHGRPRAGSGARSSGEDTTARRMVDIAVALTLLIALAPLIALIGLAVWSTSPGPALYQQPRVGRNGRIFHILKFRTMGVGADGRGALVGGRADPRITWLGRLLRPTRLDEIPQLINILRGEMSLVGPRPEVERYVRRYTRDERRVLSVRPGVLGPGALLFVDQQRELDTATDPEAHYVDHHLHDKLAYDLAYLGHRTVLADIRLGLRAVVLLTGLSKVSRRRAVSSP